MSEHVCECSDDGGVIFCERHQVLKGPGMRKLCRTRPAYWCAWEEGWGPGQSGENPNPPPPVRKQLWDLTKSLAAFVSDGLKLVSKEEYRDRLEVCDGCEHRRNTRCNKCGCSLALKARGRAFECPENRWPEPRR